MKRTGKIAATKMIFEEPPQRSVAAERLEPAYSTAGSPGSGHLRPSSRLPGDFSLQAMGHLAAAIAHELRQPLGAIQNLAYHLKITLLPANQSIAENLLLLEQQAELAERILTKLTSFAHSGEPSRTSTDLNLVLSDALRRLPPRPGIVIREELAPGLPAALADPFHADRIVSNLIANGLESMEASGILSVGTRACEDCILVEVSDTGCGIAPDQADTIFQVFVSTKPYGTGLGLALCRELAEANGGSIDFRSQPNCGTTFELRLPRA